MHLAVEKGYPADGLNYTLTSLNRVETGDSHASEVADTMATTVSPCQAARLHARGLLLWLGRRKTRRARRVDRRDIVRATENAKERASKLLETRKETNEYKLSQVVYSRTVWMVLRTNNLNPLLLTLRSMKFAMFLVNKRQNSYVMS